MFDKIIVAVASTRAALTRTYTRQNSPFHEVIDFTPDGRLNRTQSVYCDVTSCADANGYDHYEMNQLCFMRNAPRHPRYITDKRLEHVSSSALKSGIIQCRRSRRHLLSDQVQPLLAGRKDRIQTVITCRRLLRFLDPQLSERQL